ncbi:MAG: RagB/SusD family nutrient uptake outer membrane protein [Bacteroidota bacterium]
MKLSNLYLVGLLGILLSTSACDVFDATAETAINPDQAFIDEGASRSAVLGIYDALQNEDYYGAYHQYTSDNYIDVSQFLGFFQGFQEPDLGAISAFNDNVISVWAQAYQAINGANEAIDKLPNVDAVGFEEEEKTELIAESRGLRGLAYLDLITHFAEHWDMASEFGLPIIAEANDGDLAQLANPRRSTVGDSYSFILEDLLFAEANLPDSDDNTRMNKAAAQGLLARAYLHMGDYANAITWATRAIENPNFELLNNVADIYAFDGTAESLLELPASTLDPTSLSVFTISRDEVRPEESLIASFLPGDQRRALIGEVSGFVGERFIKSEDVGNDANPGYVLREAELYLIRAEAQFLDSDAGNDAQALADLNAVHTRAGLDPYEDDSDFVNKLLDEYLWEFFAEGQRFRSLVRLGQLEAVMGYESFRRIYPIPQRELNIEGTNLVQNPGYQ